MLDHGARARMRSVDTDAAHNADDTVDQPVREAAGDERPGNARHAQLLEHDDPVGPVEAVGTEREHSGRAQLVPHGAVETTAYPRGIEPAGEQRGDSVTQRNL